MRKNPFASSDNPILINARHVTYLGRLVAQLKRNCAVGNLWFKIGLIFVSTFQVWRYCKVYCGILVARKLKH